MLWIDGLASTFLVYVNFSEGLCGFCFCNFYYSKQWLKKSDIKYILLQNNLWTEALYVIFSFKFVLSLFSNNENWDQMHINLKCHRKN